MGEIRAFASVFMVPRVWVSVCGCARVCISVNIRLDGLSASGRTYTYWIFVLDSGESFCWLVRFRDNVACIARLLGAL